jgi:tryptophan-rich sensory protein
MRSWWGLVPFAAAVTAAALLGVLGVAGTSAEYQNLEQPSWAPPSWLFGPVWTILYARPLSRVAAWLLVPYWAWVTFATALNAAIWSAN